MPLRQLSKRMLKRKVKKWGWYEGTHHTIVVIFDDGKMALVNIYDRAYSSIRAWSPWVRSRYAGMAGKQADTTLGELLARLKPAPLADADPF